MYIMITYDVSDNKRRARMAKSLKDYLDRVQKSVFEGELDDEKLQLVEAKLVEEMDEDQDSLRVYPLCAACKRRIRVHGLGQVLDDPHVYIV